MQDWKDILAGLNTGKEDPGIFQEDSPSINENSAEAPKQNLKVVIDRKGRKGKTATIIEGFTLPDEGVEAVASELKRKIGTGGSARGGEILLQGDWKDKAVKLLKEKGYNVKA